MFIKKLLPVLFIVSFIAGGILQPGFSNPAQESSDNEKLKPFGDFSVCSDGSCDFTSIQGAIDSTSSGDIIHLSSETFTETLQIPFNETRTIIGDGPENTIIQAHPDPTLSTSRVILVSTQAALTLDGVTIRHGNTANDGGGIRNQGSLTVTNSLITDNSAALGGGGIANIPINNEQATLVITNTTISYNDAFQGAGIYNASQYHNSVSTVIVGNSLLSNNAGYVAGGGIANTSLASDDTGNAVLTVFNVTFSGNSVEEDSIGMGAGIFHETSSANQATSSVRQSTFVNNVAGAGGDHFHVAGGSFALKSSILAGENEDCSGESFTDEGYNLVEHASCGTPVGSSLGIEGALADNGGDTLTYALIHYSPALDLVPPGECEDARDQRGVARPYGAGCDSGAFELDQTSLILHQSVQNKSEIPGNVEPGEIITFTITAELLGPGISDGILKTNAPENLTILDDVEIDPPGSGIVGTPPTMTLNIVVSANQMVTITMYAEVALGLPQETIISHEVSLTSNEITVPEMAQTTLTVINAPPIAVDDGGAGFSTNPSTAFVTGNVLENDYDPNGDSLTYIGLNSVVQPRGNVTYNDDGTFTYDPNHQFDDMVPGQIYYDTFQYIIRDENGGFSNWATVTIVIHRENYEVFLPIVIK
jgi:hypothetical protein